MGQDRHTVLESKFLHVGQHKSIACVITLFVAPEVHSSVAETKHTILADDNSRTMICAETDIA